MNKAQVLKALHEEERRLRGDLKRVELALSAFSREEPGTEAGRAHKLHVYRRRIKLTCQRAECGKKFISKTTSARWCSPYCGKQVWAEQHRPCKAQAATSGVPSKPRPTVLVQGDPLRAGTKS